MTKATGWQAIETCEVMFAVLLFHEYYSHGRTRHGYRNLKGEWIGINANGTEGKLNFPPQAWRHLPPPPTTEQADKDD